MLEGGVSIALLDKKKDVDETGISTPEDFWTPLRPSPSSGEYKDQYGTLSSIPQHDGTDCLKTDDSLWSHAEHFKVPICASGVTGILPPSGHNFAAPQAFLHAMFDGLSGLTGPCQQVSTSEHESMRPTFN